MATGPRAICLLLLPQGRWPSQPAALAAEGERRDSVRSESTAPHPRDSPRPQMAHSRSRVPL